MRKTLYSTVALKHSLVGMVFSKRAIAMAILGAAMLVVIAVFR
jgi:hypothetical protein